MRFLNWMKAVLWFPVKVLIFVWKQLQRFWAWLAVVLWPLLKRVSSRLWTWLKSTVWPLMKRLSVKFRAWSAPFRKRIGVYAKTIFKLAAKIVVLIGLPFFLLRNTVGSDKAVSAGLWGILILLASLLVIGAIIVLHRKGVWKKIPIPKFQKGSFLSPWRVTWIAVAIIMVWFFWSPIKKGGNNLMTWRAREFKTEPARHAPVATYPCTYVYTLKGKEYKHRARFIKDGILEIENLKDKKVATLSWEGSTGFGTWSQVDPPDAGSFKIELHYNGGPVGAETWSGTSRSLVHPEQETAQITFSCPVGSQKSSTPPKPTPEKPQLKGIHTS